ncbi:hypothetical protein BO78DRAFT_319712 [Aspergillus sclerotiicarbonarius CBS 121057]|uniref:Uncharacterized protein n=1 Tax=Aspergillus sclerotiicarbonarius (strain CBS 121057 / IBT 28362) TaxID=1448318 RepID=A0A319E3Y3_ASPSB|nr:hypothetical protein BO78DRAFT_319712 [Aspergillus sclerotiicarbonarius CBS 121057]
MGDRHSDSSYDGQIEEAKIAIKTNTKTLQQLSSSAEAAKANRAKNAISSLDAAARKAKEEMEGTGKQSGKT